MTLRVLPNPSLSRWNHPIVSTPSFAVEEKTGSIEAPEKSPQELSALGVTFSPLHVDFAHDRIHRDEARHGSRVLPVQHRSIVQPPALGELQSALK
jgi:hypothetical protein